jgi:ferredoxin
MGKKVIIETEDCVGCESCVELCADVFGFDEGPQKAASFSQQTFDALSSPDRAGLTARVTDEVKTNRYDPKTGTLTLTAY